MKDMHGSLMAHTCKGYSQHLSAHPQRAQRFQKPLIAQSPQSPATASVKVVTQACCSCPYSHFGLPY